MKANELMIGDWVKVEDNEFRLGFAAKVAEVYREAIFTESGENEGECIEEWNVTPIQLTPEILEKNGFGYIKHDGEELTHFYPGEPHFCRDMDLHIGMDNKGHYWLNYRANDIYGLHSVHELQHALRLCGIEKDIVL